MERRQAADRLVAERAVGPLISTPEMTHQEPKSADVVPKGDVLEYINTLPALKAELLGRAQPEWDSSVTARMVQASYDYIDALSGILSTLAGYYPDGHFGDKDPHQFFAEQIAARFEWHRSHVEPNGPGTGGTIVNVICCGNVQADVEKMVEDMVMSVLMYLTPRRQVHKHRSNYTGLSLQCRTCPILTLIKIRIPHLKTRFLSISRRFGLSIEITLIRTIHRFSIEKRNLFQAAIPCVNDSPD